jgi:glutamyl-tRNA synthetase
VLSKHLVPFLKTKGIDAEEGEFLDLVIETLNTRSKTLEEMADAALFYYQDEIKYDEDAAKKFLKTASLPSLKGIAEALEALETFTETNLEDAFRGVMEQTGLKMGKIAQPVRVALTGKTVSPGIFEIVEVLGKKTVISRLKKAIGYIEKKM